MDKLGMIQKLNGMESRKIWGDEKCDKITGTDGTMFPPKLFQNPNATLHVYSKEMCRTVPLHFYGHSRSQDIPTLRYTICTICTSVHVIIINHQNSFWYLKNVCNIFIYVFKMKM